MKKKILFVCIGSTCRSPVAKATVNKFFGDQFEAENAGISASQETISRHSAAVIENELQWKNSGIVPQKFGSFDTADFDYIIALDSRVYDFLRERFALSADKLKLMHIDDPFGKDLKTYIEMAASMKRNFVERIPQLLSKNPTSFF